MSRWLLRTGLILVGIIVLVGVLVPSSPLLTTTAVAQPGLTAIFDLPAIYIPGQGWQIPPPQSGWHELWPNNCVPHVQTGYQDNGDGVVSPCDNIVEAGAGACWHIDKVTTTYFISCVYHPLDIPMTLESDVPPEPGSPIGQTWHVIQPDFCSTMLVSDWIDCNSNGVLDVCDIIFAGSQCWHIDKVNLDVTVSFNPATKATTGTWGWLKGLFR